MFYGTYWKVYSGIGGILGFIKVNIASNRYKNVFVRFELSKFLNIVNK